MRKIFLSLILFLVFCGPPNPLEKIIQENKGELELVFVELQKAAEQNKIRPDISSVSREMSFVPLVVETEKNGQPNAGYNAVILEDLEQLAKIKGAFDPNDPSKKGKGVFNRGVEEYLIIVGEVLFQGSRLGEKISEMSSDEAQSLATQIKEQINLVKKIRYAVFVEPGEYKAPEAHFSGGSEEPLYEYKAGSYSTVVRVFDVTKKGSYVIGFSLVVSNSPELTFNLNAGYSSDDSLKQELHSELEQKFKKALLERLAASLQPANY